MSYVIKLGTLYYHDNDGKWGGTVGNDDDATKYPSKEAAKAVLSGMNDVWRLTAHIIPVDEGGSFVLTVPTNGAGILYVDRWGAWTLDVTLAMHFDTHNSAAKYRADHNLTETLIDMVEQHIDNDGKDASYYNFPEGHEGNPYIMIDHERYPYWVRVAFVELYMYTAPDQVLDGLKDISHLCRVTAQPAFIYSAMQAVYRYGQEGRNTPIRDLNKAEYYIEQQRGCSGGDHSSVSLMTALDAIKRAQEELL